MERLTEKQSDGHDLKRLGGMYCNIYCERQNIATCNECGIQEAIERLAEYEDTGLTPKEIHKLNSFEKSQMAILLKRNAKLRKERDYWKNEALKWANELGEGRIGPLLYMDERGKYEEN